MNEDINGGIGMDEARHRVARDAEAMVGHSSVPYPYTAASDAEGPVSPSRAGTGDVRNGRFHVSLATVDSIAAEVRHAQSVPVAIGVGASPMVLVGGFDGYEGVAALAALLRRIAGRLDGERDE